MGIEEKLKEELEEARKWAGYIPSLGPNSPPRFLESSEHQGKIYLLNNFQCHLPGQIYRIMYNRQDLPIGEQKEERYKEHNSELFLSKTPAEFYLEVDNFFKEAGASDELIESMIKKRNGFFPTGGKIPLEISYSTYKLLRETGYSSSELVR